MNFSAVFIRRPVATTLLTIGLALAGAVAFFHLPVAPLPQIDLPTIMVSAQLPGASPEVVSTSVATPLERHLGVIADVSEMTSQSTVGSARVVLQFDASRSVDGAARDVEAGINAARADLPASLRANPTYRKFNPADSPIMIMSLTSKTLTEGQIYDAASTILQQKFSQVAGIGQVQIGGSALPAVRVELNPTMLFKYGIGLEDVRAALASANAHAPKGAIEAGDLHYQIYDNDQATKASRYRPLVIAYRNGAAVRLSDVAEVTDSVENVRNMGLSDGKPAILVILFKQPGANIIDTIDLIKQSLPQLEASISSDIDVSIVMDRSTTIRASLKDTERTLLIAIGLVVLVVYIFLRNARAALIPSVSIPVSLIATCGAMYLMGYSLDNLSLMALTISTGFVVDDAIVVMENITRHVEAGMTRFRAALLGAREVGFTVLSMSLSLVAVFAPITFMGGLIGKFFGEFATTLSITILVSLIVSLTTTPMMCARMIELPTDRPPGRLMRISERGFDWILRGYDRSLRLALLHPRSIIVILLGTIVLGVYVIGIVPKGFLPVEDTGLLIGNIRADQSISFQLMREKLTRFVSVVQQDPAVAHVVGFTGGGGGPMGGQTNSGTLFISLKPLGERRIGGQDVIARLRSQLQIPGAVTTMQEASDVRVGGRQGNAAYQFTVQSDDLSLLYQWMPKIVQALRNVPEITDIDSDLQQGGLESDLVIDRATASRLGITASQIDNTLYDAFGQRQVSTIYNALNQYHVIMEVAPEWWQSPEMLKDIYVSTAGGAVGGVEATNAVAGTVVGTGQSLTASTIAQSAQRNLATNQLAASGHSSASTGAAVSAYTETMVPLAAIAHFEPGKTPLGVNHQGLTVAGTISYNLAPGASLSTAATAIQAAMNQIGVPSSIRSNFAGTAQIFQQSLAAEPYLILGAIAAVYILLGILYESLIHPITILSTLPSAGMGAVLALYLANMELDIIALIGIFLLIGIVKKNAIMMVDFAIETERRQNLTSREAIYQACLMRFRPIMMTTMAAIFGAAPLALSFGEGSELHKPLGVAIIGGLVVSQLLTLYTTPVIYLYLDRFGLWAKRRLLGRGAFAHPHAATGD